eukprot:TRINITY_DN58883_c0_g1_i1.p1 TRINITY_DN58883_c0_g1~~TRINITY_DN58883_c0_g1_i1.p1  ORF type:complete len:127 (-),score=6.06 TRINITY_DN58883_c0_g1_i1:49-429(-)
MIRRPPRSTLSSSSAASDVYKRQLLLLSTLIPSSPSSCKLRSWAVTKVFFTVPTTSMMDRILLIPPTIPYREATIEATTVMISARIVIYTSVSYTHLRAHETPEHLVCRLLLEKKKRKTHYNDQNL